MRGHRTTVHWQHKEVSWSTPKPDSRRWGTESGPTSDLSAIADNPTCIQHSSQTPPPLSILLNLPHSIYYLNCGYSSSELSPYSHTRASSLWVDSAFFAASPSLNVLSKNCADCMNTQVDWGAWLVLDFYCLPPTESRDAVRPQSLNGHGGQGRRAFHKSRKHEGCYPLLKSSWGKSMGFILCGSRRGS